MGMNTLNSLDKSKLISGGFVGDLDFKIAMKTNDLRDILLEAIKSGRETNAEVDANTLKDLLSKVESIRVSW